jgi:hypothetical protein
VLHFTDSYYQLAFKIPSVIGDKISWQILFFNSISKYLYYILKVFMP